MEKLIPVLDDSSSSAPDLNASSQLGAASEEDFIAQLTDRFQKQFGDMKQKIKDIESEGRKEKTKLHDEYEAGKLRLHRLLDAKTSQVAEMEKKCDTAVANCENLVTRLTLMQLDLKASDQARMQAESLVDNFQARVNSLEIKLKNLEGENATLISRLTHMQLDLKASDQARMQAESLVDSFQARVNSLENQLSVEGENANTSTTQHQVSFSGSSSAQRGTNTRRVQASGDEYDYTHITRRYESGQDGPITIDSGDEEGKSVTLRNDSNEDVHIGGWQLRVVANNEKATYEFHNKMNFKAGTTITVWSANTGVTRKPPSDLVMKSRSWPVGANPEAVLTDSSGTRMAWMVPVTVGEDVLEEKVQDKCALM